MNTHFIETPSRQKGCPASIRARPRSVDSAVLAHELTLDHVALVTSIHFRAQVLERGRDQVVSARDGVMTKLLALSRRLLTPSSALRELANTALPTSRGCCLVATAAAALHHLRRHRCAGSSGSCSLFGP